MFTITQQNPTFFAFSIQLQFTIKILDNQHVLRIVETILFKRQKMKINCVIERMKMENWISPWNGAI